MKYYLIDLINSDTKDLWIENNNIPFKKKNLNKSTMKNSYESCFFYKDNIELLDKLPNNINYKFNFENNKPLSNDIYFIYSDGGSFNNGKKDSSKPEFGSTATLIYKNNKDEIFSFTEAKENVTNNFCELNAGLIGLDYLNENIKGNKKVILLSDSQYYIKSINEWLDGYVRRGWKNNEGREVSNKELLEKYFNYLHNENFEILTCWVKGHENKNNILTERNNICDKMCNQSINKVLLENNLPIRK